MRPIKFGLTTTEHMYHQINPRSKVNLYFQKNSEIPPAFQAATVTVDQSLIKSRVVSQSWVNHLKKKQETGSKMGFSKNWIKQTNKHNRSQTIDNLNTDVISISSGLLADQESERMSHNKTQSNVSGSKAISMERRKTLGILPE